MALLKAELQYARIQRDGLTLRERLFSSVDLLGRLGCTLPWLANCFLDSSLVRIFWRKSLGITLDRPLPHYTRQRFDRWFARRHAVRNRARADG